MENNTSEIVVFTDANVILDKKSLKEINRIFSSDEKIGCVEGNLFYINSENLSAFSSGYYWTYEQFIKTYESKTGSMMGADGSIFAIRKKIFKTLPLYVLDDFSTSMNSIFMGYRLIKSSSILAYEKTSTSSRDEFNRKIRISNRSYNTYRYLKNSIWSMDIFNRYKFFFHKYIRWHSFTIMILIYLSNLYLIFNCKCMNIYFLFIIQNIFYLFALLGFLASEKKPSNIFMKIISFCYYFFSANLASFIGIFKSYLGSKIQFWETIKSGR
jgi:cellulose synthase/poly-beta-1,6-N-acetylglucosamine synthase-like glycosyltransferase